MPQLIADYPIPPIQISMRIQARLGSGVQRLAEPLVGASGVECAVCSNLLRVGTAVISAAAVRQAKHCVSAHPTEVVAHGAPLRSMFGGV